MESLYTDWSTEIDWPIDFAIELQRMSYLFFITDCLSCHIFSATNEDIVYMFSLVWKSFHLEVISYYKWGGGNWSHRGEKTSDGRPANRCHIQCPRWDVNPEHLTGDSECLNHCNNGCLSYIYILVCADIPKFCLLSAICLSYKDISFFLSLISLIVCPSSFPGLYLAQSSFRFIG